MKRNIYIILDYFLHGFIKSVNIQAHYIKATTSCTFKIEIRKIFLVIFDVSVLLRLVNFLSLAMLSFHLLGLSSFSWLLSSKILTKISIEIFNYNTPFYFSVSFSLLSFFLPLRLSEAHQHALMPTP